MGMMTYWLLTRTHNEMMKRKIHLVSTLVKYAVARY